MNGSTRLQGFLILHDVTVWFLSSVSEKFMKFIILPRGMTLKMQTDIT